MLSWIHALAAVGSMGLSAYLVYALCRPENFQDGEMLAMLDLIFIGIFLAFFAACSAFVLALRNL